MSTWIKYMKERDQKYVDTQPSPKTAATKLETDEYKV